MFVYYGLATYVVSFSQVQIKPREKCAVTNLEKVSIVDVEHVVCMPQSGPSLIELVTQIISHWRADVGRKPLNKCRFAPRGLCLLSLVPHYQKLPCHRVYLPSSLLPSQRVVIVHNDPFQVPNSQALTH